MNGRACYWVAGKRVGDFNIIDSLRDVLFCWERMSFNRDRSNEELSRLNTEDLINTLYRSLYNSGHADQEAYHRRGIDGAWAGHDINPGTAAFSGWIILVVESPSSARCLYAGSVVRLSGYGEQPLHPGEFSRVLDRAISYLMQEYQRVGGT